MFNHNQSEENIFLQIELPDSVIEANSVDTFKNWIEKYWNNFEITGRLTPPDQRLQLKFFS